MRKSEVRSETYLILEVLGVNALDLAQFLQISKTAVIDYNTGKYKAESEKAEMLDELTGLIVKAGTAAKGRTPPPSPAELKALQKRYWKNETAIGRLAFRLAFIYQDRDYALRTQQLINELEPLLTDKTAKDPILGIVRMARARNTKRMNTHALDKITIMQANLAALRASQVVITKVLNRYDKGWKKKRGARDVK